MNVGDCFIDVDGQGVAHDCRVVWSGDRGHWLCAHKPWPMQASVQAGESQQPAKGVSGRGRPAPVRASQARLFA